MRLKISILATLLVASLPLRSADAFPYESFVDIDTEEDIYDLFTQGEISEDTRDTLVQLLQKGVDLNTADRGELYTLPNLTYRDVDKILTYREETGFISDPVALVPRALSERKLLAIAPFLIVGQRSTSFAADGMIRYQVRWTAEDDRGAPPMAVIARVNTLKHLRIGVAGVLTQNRIGAPSVDPVRQSLNAAPQDTRLNLPKFYAHYDTTDYALLLGTYQIGFGQRLTFDNTNQVDANGIYADDRLFRSTDLSRECRESAGELDTSPCTGAAGDVYTTPDFTWRERLMGVAAGIKGAEVGSGEIQAYGFASYQPKSVYQYQLYNPNICENPRNDSDPNCSSPDIFVRRDDLLEPTSRFSFVTLPNAYAETTVGGNLSYRFNRRSHLGITGYRSDISFLTDGLELDFQEWARTPFGGAFGAVGVNGSYGKNWADVFFEVTRSFDGMPDDDLGPGGGGIAGLVRGVITSGKHEFSATARYYDKKFANPYARPISAADQFEGLRARNEVGGRLLYQGEFDKRLRLRANIDLWSPADETQLQGLVFVRGDVNYTDQWRFGLWGEARRTDLEGANCRLLFGDEFEISDEAGNLNTCNLERIQLIPRIRYAPTKKYWFDLLYRHEFHDGGRQDLSATGIITAKLAENYRVRLRTRWLWDEIDDNESLEQSLWSYLDFTIRMRERDRLRLRYDFRIFLDDRTNTQDRMPLPEHWLWLEYEAKF